jgi:5'-phosphate synthase pdxT subunit
MAQPKIGIFALQGVFVRMPDQFSDLDGLIIPGGESTTYLKVMEPYGVDQAIIDFAHRGGSIFGTCAGTITIAREVTNPAQRSLNLMDIVVERNSYGRQLDSADAIGEALEPLGHGPLHMTFIRAPRITGVGEGVQVLATYKGDPVLVQQGKMLAGTFHPELSGAHEIYTYWFNLMSNNAQ